MLVKILIEFELGQTLRWNLPCYLSRVIVIRLTASLITIRTKFENCISQSILLLLRFLLFLLFSGRFSLCYCGQLRSNYQFFCVVYVDCLLFLDSHVCLYVKKKLWPVHFSFKLFIPNLKLSLYCPTLNAYKTNSIVLSIKC